MNGEGGVALIFVGIHPNGSEYSLSSVKDAVKKASRYTLTLHGLSAILTRLVIASCTKSSCVMGCLGLGCCIVGPGIL
ncbi:hypothetical protein HanPI659440_Chr00c12g0725681 [Helianthus annuus]|nr:hypothetical protein HanPI659440_Chr00c12g0725681 [Helianthus annuus]